VHDGARSIGAAVLDERGRPLAALVVSAPSDRLAEVDFPAVGAQVRTAAAQLGGGVHAVA
jgi:DNA-binding IclR family transcriptional regulator